MPKQRTSGNVRGGGLGSRVVVHKPVITGKPARGIDPGGPSQLGSAIGNHSTDRGQNLSYRGEKWFDGRTPAGGAVPLGNSVALNVKGGGVGTGRTVYPQGSQSKPGPTRDPNASGRDILRDFGPDFKR
jgi:hypothetical protein